MEQLRLRTSPGPADLIPTGRASVSSGGVGHRVAVGAQETHSTVAP